jgi:hypothetical protein
VTYINSGKLPATLWLSRAAASSLQSTFPGTSVLGAGFGTEPCAVAVQSVSRVRGHVVFAIPVPPKAAPAVQLGQPNSDNYMTSGSAVGVTAVGPPQHREPV